MIGSSREFLGFLVTGGVAASVNFFSRWVYSLWLGFEWAVVLAYITGMVTAFALARRFVFTQTSQSMGRSAFWFLLVNGLALCQTWGVSVVLVRWVLPAWGVVEHAEEIAHAAGIAVPVVTSYWGHKHLSFR